MHGFPLQRLLATAVILGGALFLGLQFVRPPLSNPPVTADLDAPAPVKAILRNSCYDCHSNETKLLWFDQIVPAYWLVARDVRVGRERLNFSEIGSRPPAQQKGALYESVSRVMLDSMPPRNYLLLHPKAAVTPEQLAALKAYLTPASPAPGVPPTPLPPPPAEVRPAPNGMTFFPDYKNWRVISTTDRFDNNTMRIITGNEVAIQAIAEGRVQPWPDGAAFAKIALSPSPDGKAATFRQVEFMVKDAKRYAATAGWGWARWVGGDLAPYGKSPDFAMECVHCHLPLEKNDFVFSLPLKQGPADESRFNTGAALPEGLGLPPDLLSWQAASASLDPAGTMSTLYANGPALAAARAAQPYPPGAVLARVTWTRRDDPHWFGARIPGKVQAVETLTVSGGADGKPAYAYASYGGAVLTKEPPLEGAALQARIDALLAEKASPLP